LFAIYLQLASNKRPKPLVLGVVLGVNEP
jgi:hypothetical protein